MNQTLTLSGIAGVATYVTHEILHGGLWESVPFATGETMAVGIGLAAIAAIGTYVSFEVAE